MQQEGTTSRQWKAAEKTRMPRLVLCEPTELYNILNQVTKLSRLIEPNYLCLLDVRSKREYDESHVITALHVKKKMNEYLLPESVDLECVKYCVVYDNNTSTLEELDAFQPYPIEIVPGKVFLGNFSQACDPKIQKDLKIKAHINVSMETGPFFAGEADRLLHIQIEDSPEAQILPFLRHLCHFTGSHIQLGSVILIFSTRGISRSCAAAIAYLMHSNEQTLQRSWAYVKKCKNNMCPNWGLVTQLLEWEKIILGGFITNITDLLY
ncbi:serine/threonine/tyrosine-interacting-like protein 1 isoform X6 [Sapajus apella]|uniref:Serine/threonine/tyrosine-interacting-like protein 1 isoform X6 n=1 Tax=Sapajus apella TaxID=9515 RepID=A0A6J3G093_SAPAP|nr:serine/threonine/tyrosine-interacting-like protein 1 isoform X6 [Sapajus apella]